MCRCPNLAVKEAEEDENMEEEDVLPPVKPMSKGTSQAKKKKKSQSKKSWVGEPVKVRDLPIPLICPAYALYQP